MVSVEFNEEVGRYLVVRHDFIFSDFDVSFSLFNLTGKAGYSTWYGDYKGAGVHL